MTQAEIDAGTFTNTADVAATDPDGPPGGVTDDDPDTQELEQTPGIVILKVGTLNDEDSNGVSEGDTISYLITVANTGNVTLSSVVVSDTGADAAPSFSGGDDDNDGELDVDETGPTRRFTP